MNKGLIVETLPLDVYEQMACDEVLCELMPAKYIIRFFNWKGNGITFGFSQRFRDVVDLIDDHKKKYPITRRPTGGGVVIHEDDLTFSLIFYSPGEFNPKRTYDMLHKAIYDEYKMNGFNLTILNDKSNYSINNPTMECFKRPVEMDLMIGEKKVLGGALRKFSDYMLYQASLQISNARYDFIHKSFIIEAFKKLFKLDYIIFDVDDEFMKKIGNKKNEKYANKDWIERI